MAKQKIERFEVLGKVLFWKEERALIIGDLHLGFEEVLKEQGWQIPKVQMKETLEDFKIVLDRATDKKKIKLSEIILLGDIKHYFAGVLRAEFRDFGLIRKLFMEYLEEDGKIIIVKGNHDAIIEPIINVFENVDLKMFYLKKDVLFVHGDHKSLNLKLEKELKNEKLDGRRTWNKIKLIVVGHFHPAITLKDRQKTKQENYKCFLYGKSKEFEKNMLVVPSFLPLIAGTDVSQRDSKMESRIQVENFEVFALDDEGKMYDFGKVKNLR